MTPPPSGVIFFMFQHVGSKFRMLRARNSCENILTKNVELQADDPTDYSDSYHYYDYQEMSQPQMTQRYDIDGYENITCAEAEHIDVLGGSWVVIIIISNQSYLFPKI